MAEKSAHLSKNVLQMKFMQRSVLRLEREQNEEDKQKIIDDEHWVLDLPDYRTKESSIMHAQSYTTCEELVFGRQSYQGCNPEIEKLMNTHRVDQELEKSAEIEKKHGVSETKMTSRFSTLVGVIANKFAKKRNRADSDDASEPPGKRKFIKPEPEDDP